jgi:hypothetical protein
VREALHTDGQEQGDALFCSPETGCQTLCGLQKVEDHDPLRERATTWQCLVRKEEDRDPQDAEHGLFRIGLTLIRTANTFQKIYQYKICDAQILNFFLSQTMTTFILHFCQI